ncbi:MAG TPA: sterol desaturase family protein [Myxococcaceae bacterium]|nr:sterol desaturase family protein [Myxococcaceae bacterium]
MRIALLIVFGAAAVMMIAEKAFRGRSWPQVAGWWGRAALLNGIQLGVVFLSGVAWDGWMLKHRPWPADGLGIVGGAAVGYAVHTFVYYWWHRARHASPFLWRWVHQVHHSPQRIELITSFYKHPVEVLCNGVLSSAVLYLGVGLTPEQASAVFVLNALAEFFYHWNVPTPVWLGYLFQRPESHCVHHQEGLHAFNYGDLPVFDILFGTFRNPGRWDGKCGFGTERELRLGAMLAGADVNAEGRPV